MEPTIYIYAIIKFLITIVTIFVVYRTAKAKFKNKVLNTLSITVVIIWLFIPFKWDTPTSSYQQTMNEQIKLTKQLPPKVIDDSFKESTNIKGITPEDLK